MKINTNKFLKRTSHLPIAYTGLSLGFGGIGNCLSLLFNNFNNSNFNASWISYITIFLVIFILLVITIRNCCHPKLLKWELKEQMMVSLLPTYCMSFMLVAGFIASFDSYMYSSSQIIGSILLIIAVGFHFVILGYFIFSVYKHNFKIKNDLVYGSYYVPPIGLIVACTVANNFSLIPNEFFQFIWYFGFISYVLMFLFVTYFMLFKNKPEESRYASIAVWFAPINLVPSGFIKVFMWITESNYSQTYIFTLFILTTIWGFVFSSLLYIYIFRTFKNYKFNPVFCSMTFPSAIGATSMVLTAGQYRKLATNILDTNSISYQFFNSGQWIFGIAGFIFSIVSFLIISYILVRMFILGYKILFTNLKDNETHPCYLSK
ncbi:hypothetical protein [Malacoplasma penetrans]|nr:hypothetical protein [Malacoplasma penetrans]